MWSFLYAAVEWLREKLIAYGSSDRGHSARYAFIVVRHGCIWVSRMLASRFCCVRFLQISDTDEQTRHTTDTADHTSPHQAHLVPHAQTRSLRVPAVRRHSALNSRHVSISGLKAATSCTRPNPSTISGLSAPPRPSSRLAASAATGGLDWLTGCRRQLLGEDFLTIFRGWHIRKSRCRLLLSCFTSSPPSTSSQLRSNSQTSAHRRLSAAVHSTQKNLKIRKNPSLHRLAR